MAIDVTHSTKDRVTRLTLARPEKRNALTTAMLEQLAAAAGAVSDEPETRVVIIDAAGDDFSVGADLDMLQQSEPLSLLEQRKVAEAGGRMLRAIREIRQPTIAVLKGVATGGGACIASACDFRIACDNTRIGYGEVRMGMNLMWQALPLCVHLVGPARAKQLIMSGALFSAEQLVDWGWLDALCSAEQLDSEAAAWAARYATLPPMAVQMIKRSINHYAGALDQAILHADSDQWLLATRSADFDEALKAFLEKRPPHFTGN